MIIQGDVAKWLRQGFAKPLFGGSIPPVASKDWGMGVGNSVRGRWSCVTLRRQCEAT